MVDLSTTLTSILTAVFGVLCGATIGAYFNLKSARKDLIFKRKLEYFEKLVQDLEENFRLHKKAILATSESSKKKQIESSYTELQKNRKTFLIKASPLYFNIEKLTEKMTSFAQTEKEIFSSFENLIRNYKIISKASKKRLIFDLNEKIAKLNSSKDAIILEMKSELKDR